jgi:hypothetical protein
VSIRARGRGSVALALIAALAAMAPTASANGFGGIIRDVPTDTGAALRTPAFRAPVIAHAANLPYGGGPVLHANRTHLVFWAPAGSGLGYEPGFQRLIRTFLANVAADSRKPTNVYGLSGQYRDAGGPAAYASTFAGAVTATDPLPANGCLEPLLTGPGWGVCLSDGQLEDELAHVIATDHLPADRNDIYFLLTPNGMGDCLGSGPDDCALGGNATGYCGYHSASRDSQVLYAVIPYNAVPGHCQSDRPRPNASPADPTISSLSHEHNETVTDPLGNAYVDGSRLEDGDLCLMQFGPPVGGAGASVWNEDINGGHYYLQEEWSNDDGSCQPRDETDALRPLAPARARLGQAVSFSASASDPDGLIVAYSWFFADRRGGRGRRVSHTFARAGSHRIVLRTTDSSGNYAYASSLLTVTRR